MEPDREVINQIVLSLGGSHVAIENIEADMKQLFHEEITKDQFY